MKHPELHIYILFVKIGPDLPKKLAKHSMAEIQGDLYIFGGYDGTYQNKIYRLICVAGNCFWTTLNQQMTVARSNLVVIPVEDSLCSTTVTTTITTTTTTKTTTTITTTTETTTTTSTTTPTTTFTTTTGNKGN